jgi:seryl-tRNA synthetase
MKINEMMNELFDLKNQLHDSENTEKNIKEKIEKIKFAIMDYLESNCIQNIKDDVGRMVFMKEPAVRASIKAESKDQAHDWLKENGYEYAIQPSVHHLVLSKILKERLNNGDQIPDYLFTYFLQKDIGTRI